MTLFECTLLLTNTLALGTIYYLFRANRKINKQYREYLLESIDFYEKTLREIDVFKAALDDCEENIPVKVKVKKDAKKATTK
jgi:hypothetical protein